jgi:ketosteroid isomerase-like protein
MGDEVSAPSCVFTNITKGNHMKLTTSLIGIAALGFITSAFAQEEETASPAPEEKPSTTIEETPTPAPEAKTIATPAERPAAQKKEKPATPAPGKPTSTAAAAPAKKNSVEAALKELENKWEAAIAAHDASFLQSAVASDFVGIYSNGKFINRSGLISAEIKSDTNTYTSTKNEKLNVRVFKPNVAVVTGNAREKGTAKDGKAFDRTYAFTDTWMERNGQWQCIASQGMLLSQR